MTDGLGSHPRVREAGRCNERATALGGQICGHRAWSDLNNSLSKQLPQLVRDGSRAARKEDANPNRRNAPMEKVEGLHYANGNSDVV